MVVIYDNVMKVLYVNLDSIKFFEVNSIIDNVVCWKNMEEFLKNKKVCEVIIKKYCEYYSK